MKKLFLSLILIIALSFCVVAQTYDLHTPKKIPTIVVPFLEETAIETEDYTLTDLESNNIAMTHTTTDNYTYEFTPTKALNLGQYILTITPKDTLGNIGDTVTINLYIDPITVKLTNPPLGVSSTQAFDLTLQTTDKAACRYSIPPIEITDPEQYNIEGAMQDIDTTDGITHTIQNFPAKEYPDQTPLWIVCKDNFEGLTQVYQFMISYDTTPPTIQQAYAEPSNVIEFTQIGTNPSNKTIQTNLKAITDKPAICTYTIISPTYNAQKQNLNQGIFDTNNITDKDTFTTDNTKTLTNLNNIGNHRYNIQCTSLALLTTNQTEIDFNVNLSQAFGITSTNPDNGGYIGTTTYTLNVSTNKDATCNKTTNGITEEITKQGKTGNNYQHSKETTGTEGKNSISIDCRTAADHQQKTIQFTIDTTPPNGIKIETGNYTWLLDQLSAEFFFEDNQSGIDHYTYTIKDSSQNIIIENQQTTANKITVKNDKDGKKLNLTDKEKYFWYVTATNKAGIISQELIGTTDVDTTKKPKDIYPPTITLTTILGNRGTNITITCLDQGLVSSGCDANNSYYGTSDTENCAASTKYAGTFIITKAQYVCYTFQDKAQPPNTAQNTTFVNVSARLDTDADQIYDSFDKCLNTPPGEPVDENGCSCTQLDDDSDGINNCNDKCPNTPPTETPRSDGCSESQRDTDHDGIPDTKDKCPNTPQNTTTDANGCSQDQIDTDHDGIPDYKDKCPKTPPASTTDANGCADSERDIDTDGIPDIWEQKYTCMNSTAPDANLDYDNDGLTNIEEYKHNTDPCKADTDGDGIPDKWEIDKGLNPNDPTDAEKDQDNDGLLSIEEYTQNQCLDPLNADTDGDGYNDKTELDASTDPCDPNSHPYNFWPIIIILISLIILGVGGYFGYKYLYPMIEKKFGKPTLRKWPPFERVVGRPRITPQQPTTKKPQEKIPEKPKPKTTTEKLAALASTQFDKLTNLSKPKEETKITTEEGKEIKEAKEAAKIEAKEETTADKLDNLSRSAIDKLEKLSSQTQKPKQKEETKPKTSANFDLLEQIGKAETKKDIFEALPGKEKDVFAELRKSIPVKQGSLESITKGAAEKNIKELVKTFEELKSEQGIKTSLNIFKTLLGHLLKTKKITIKDIEEVMIKLKQQGIFTEKQISDVLFGLKE